MIPDGQLRMITQGQELLIDYDEKTLAEMGFKDTQVSVLKPIGLELLFLLTLCFQNSRSCMCQSVLVV